MQVETKYLDVMKTAPDSLDAEKRELTAIISTNDVDRDGEIVEPSAFKARIKTYMQNPVLLWSHDRMNPPIGRALNVDFKDDRMESRLQFRKEGESELADNVWSLFKQGMLSTFSIGFRVFKMEFDEGEDGKKPEPPRITEAELFETSAVSVPANPNAVAKMISQCQLLTEGKAPDSIFQMGGVVQKVAADHRVTTLYTSPTDEEILGESRKIIDRFFKRCMDGGQPVGGELELIENLRVALLGTRGPEKESPDVKALEDLTDHLRELITEKV